MVGWASDRAVWFRCLARVIALCFGIDQLLSVAHSTYRCVQWYRQGLDGLASHLDKIRITRSRLILRQPQLTPVSRMLGTENLALR